METSYAGLASGDPDWEIPRTKGRPHAHPGQHRQRHRYSESLQRWASEHLSETLERFQQDITRIEVQLGDENSAKAGTSDKRCMMEARLAGLQPVAVHHHADTQDEAFRGAARKLLNALDHSLGKLRDHHRDRDSIRKDVPIAIVPGTSG